MTCAEDVPRITTRRTENGARRTSRAATRRDKCSPCATVAAAASAPADFTQPVQERHARCCCFRAALDPVTPPAYGGRGREDACRTASTSSPRLSAISFRRTRVRAAAHRGVRRSTPDSARCRRIVHRRLASERGAAARGRIASRRSHDRSRRRSQVVRQDGGEIHAVRECVVRRAGRRRSPACLGPNGAGKTTLLRMLATLIVPDAGTRAIGGPRRRRATATRCASASACCRTRAASTRGSPRAKTSATYGALHGLAGRRDSTRASTH